MLHSSDLDCFNKVYNAALLFLCSDLFLSIRVLSGAAYVLRISAFFIIIYMMNPL